MQISWKIAILVKNIVKIFSLETKQQMELEFGVKVSYKA